MLLRTVIAKKVHSGTSAATLIATEITSCWTTPVHLFKHQKIPPPLELVVNRKNNHAATRVILSGTISSLCHAPLAMRPPPPVLKNGLASMWSRLVPCGNGTVLLSTLMLICCAVVPWNIPNSISWVWSGMVTLWLWASIVTVWTWLGIVTLWL